MNKDIKVVSFTKNGLKKAMDENLFWKHEPSPFSRHKATWITNNQRIADDDACVVVGFDKEKVISYIWIISDLFQTRKNNYEKKYWFSDWGLDDAYRDTGIAALVFFKACKLINNQVFISAYSNSAGEFYDKLGQFKPFGSRINYFLFFALDEKMIIRKFKKLKPFAFGVHLLNWVISLLFRPVNWVRANKRLKNTESVQIDQLDNDTWEFIKERSKGDLVEKTKDHVNWQIDNEPYIPDTAHIRPDTCTENIQILAENKIVGFLSYIKTDDSFEIKYFIPLSKNELNLCADVLVQHLIRSKAKYISTYNKDLAQTIKDRYLIAYLHKDHRKAIVHKQVELDEALGLTIKDCEGA
jgi:hypothetical protein